MVVVVVAASSSTLLIGMERMNITLTLSSRRTQLKPELGSLQPLVQSGNGAEPQILQPCADARGEVREVGAHGSLVHHGPGDTLGHLNLRPGGKVPLLGPLGHGLDGPHAAVLLQPHAVLKEVVPGRFLGAGQHAPHHHHAGPDGQRLHGMPRGGDAAVGDHGHAEPPGHARRVVHRRGLRAPHGTHLLRGADGADAHAHAQAVHPAADQVVRLPRRHHVAAHHVHLRVRGLDPADEVVLVHGVPLGGVDHNQVRARLHQRRAPLAVVGPGADAAADQQLLGRVQAGPGEVAVLLQVVARDQRHQPARPVHHGQLALLGPLQDGVRLLQVHALWCSHQLVQWGHDS
mmetsp:Transcript_36982/g.54166  ORF Transcript_36982/g.54166 Transcript_36982/m.54166 type:complete len:346 (+) Transcript_36982:249-1286(+)